MLTVVLVLASRREVEENEFNIQGELIVARKERFPDLGKADDADFKAIVRISYDALIGKKMHCVKRPIQKYFFLRKVVQLKKQKKYAVDVR